MNLLYERVKQLELISEFTDKSFGLKTADAHMILNDLFVNLKSNTREYDDVLIFRDDRESGPNAFYFEYDPTGQQLLCAGKMLDLYELLNKEKKGGERIVLALLNKYFRISRIKIITYFKFK